MFVLSTQAAALLGDADGASLAGLEIYGRSIGMAYQIVDDVLDFAGSAQRVGKPVGSDLRQGLYTLPAIIYADTHSSDAALRILSDGGNREADSVEAVVEAVRESGAVEEALREARIFAAQARAAIEGLSDSVYVRALSNLAEYIVHRDL